MQTVRKYQFQVSKGQTIFQIVFYYFDVIFGIIALILFASQDDKATHFAMTLVLLLLERLLQIFVFFYQDFLQKIPHTAIESFLSTKEPYLKGMQMEFKLLNTPFWKKLLAICTYTDGIYFYYLTVKSSQRNIEILNQLTKLRGIFFSNIQSYVVANAFLIINNNNYTEEGKSGEIVMFLIIFLFNTLNFTYSNMKVYTDSSGLKHKLWELTSCFFIIYFEYLVFQLWVGFFYVQHGNSLFLLMGLFFMTGAFLEFTIQGHSPFNLEKYFTENKQKFLSFIYRGFISLEAGRATVFYVKYEKTQLDSIDHLNQKNFFLFSMKQKRTQLIAIFLRIIYLILIIGLSIYKENWQDEIFQEYRVIAVIATIYIGIFYILQIIAQILFSTENKAYKKLEDKKLAGQKLKSGYIFWFLESKVTPRIQQSLGVQQIGSPQNSNIPLQIETKKKNQDNTPSQRKLNDDTNDFEASSHTSRQQQLQNQKEKKKEKSKFPLLSDEKIDNQQQQEQLNNNEIQEIENQEQQKKVDFINSKYDLTKQEEQEQTHQPQDNGIKIITTPDVDMNISNQNGNQNKSQQSVTSNNHIRSISNVESTENDKKKKKKKKQNGLTKQQVDAQGAKKVAGISQLYDIPTSLTTKGLDNPKQKKNKKSQNQMLTEGSINGSEQGSKQSKSKKRHQSQLLKADVQNNIMGVSQQSSQVSQGLEYQNNNQEIEDF